MRKYLSTIAIGALVWVAFTLNMPAGAQAIARIYGTISGAPIALTASSLGYLNVNVAGGTFAIPVVAPASGTCVTPSFTFTGDTDTGIGYLGANNAAGCANGATIFDWNASRVLFAQPIQMTGTSLVKWGTTNAFGALRATNALVEAVLADESAYATFKANTFTVSGGTLNYNGTTFLTEDAANTLAQRNGTNAQAFRIYQTYTDASNYERAFLGWSASDFYIAAQYAGTGAAHQLIFQTGNASRWLINTSGHWLASTTNTYDIGTSATVSAPRTVYAGTSVVSPVVNATTGYQASGVSTIVNVASNFTTANNTNLQTITGLTWLLPASTALNMPFSCKLEWSQATAAVAVSFGLQTDTVTPSNFLGLGQMETNLTVTSYGDVAIANTTATVVVTGTPAATATTYNAYIDGFIENPSNGSTTNVNVMVKTATGADAVTVYRGSYCRAF